MPDQDLLSIQAARDQVEAAHQAHAAIAGLSQVRIDEICEAMAAAAGESSMRLATLACEETGYGNPADKNVKNLFAAVNIHGYFRGLKTTGVIRETPTVVEIASPRGVVAGIVPSTNPTSTAIFKILISIKSRNCIVLSPHPSATNCVIETARLMREAAVGLGLPGEAIGCLDNITPEATDTLMKHKRTAVILATGGLGLVRAAYSSGKPAFGVGPGNVPAFIERSADIPKAVSDVLAGKCFDYGTICASEQALIVDASIDRQVREQLAAQGGFFINESQTEALAQLAVTPNRQLNPRIVGKPATTLARWAAINVPAGTRCLMVRPGGVGRDYPLSMEKLSPILAYYVVNGLEEGSRLADEILHYGGMGHTAAIHTRSREAALRYGELMPASRIVVNTPSTHGAIGFSTDLAPSMTLGCGSWGGNVTSDNISPLHLMDIKRVAFEVRPVGSSSGVKTPPTHGPGSVATSSPAWDREAINRLVDRVFASRSTTPTVPPASSPTSSSVAPAPAPASTPPVTPGPKPEPPPPVDFVSEEDVRQAIRAGVNIHIGPRTIITPAARDLAGAHAVFVEQVRATR